MAAEAWQDFGQKVDLTARIREILLNYPEGTSILKELVQNADDARATCIKFCLDCRQHGTGSLLSPAMKPFQGPALLAFNDGVFSDRDLESISRIGDSKKKEEEGKTGRFGVGFNSCYHLTDLPSFVSGRHLVIFDPHCRHLPNISATNPGKRIDFVQYGDVATLYADQVAPYTGAFGCTLGLGVASVGPWPGTLFRFPLRSTELAEASTISKQVYTPRSIRSLLEQLAAESFQVLLFLKHISRIEVHEWPPDAAAPQLLFSCHVSNLTQEVSWERGLFARVSGERPSKLAAGSGAENDRTLLPEVLSTYRLELRRDWYGNGGAGAAAVVRQPERRSYIISQVRGGGEVAEMAEQLSKHFGAVVAWGAVAADVTTAASSAGGGEGGEVEAAGPPEDGRAFCFLPLPIRTGLPVHVNGYFELSSNRRDIWYGEDMTGSGARRAQWNMQLLLRVIAPAYAAALTAAAAALGHGEAYDRLWPAADVAQPWQSLLEQFFRLVGDMALCWSTMRGGCWVAPFRGVLRDKVVAAKAPLAAALVEVAALPLLEVPQGVGQLMQQHMTAKPRVCSPALARQALLTSLPPLLPPPTTTTTTMTTRASASASEPSTDTALRSHAPALLDYCLSDLMPSVTETSLSSSAPAAAGLSTSAYGAPSTLWNPVNPGRGSVPAKASGSAVASSAAAASAASQQVAHAAAQLAGLRLLPLLDGTTATLQAASAKQHNQQQQQQHSQQHYNSQQHQLRSGPPISFFLPSAEECRLLARAGGLLVDATGLSPSGRAKLTALAVARLLNVAQLDAPAMVAVVLPRLLPPAWLVAPTRRVVDWQAAAAAAAAGVDRDWLRLLWSWMATHAPLSSFLGLPLLPILGGRLAPLSGAASCTAVLPPTKGSVPVVVECGGAGGGGGGADATDDPAAQLSDVLTQLGLQILDLDSFPDLPVSDLLRGGHVNQCDGPGILAALQRLLTTTQATGRTAAGDGIGEQLTGDGGDAAVGHGRSESSIRAVVGLTARVTALAAVDKRLLRSVLLTDECLSVLTASGQPKGAAAGRPPLPQAEQRALIQLLAMLPIYESARGSGGGDGATGKEPLFMALSSSGTCFLAPPGVDLRVLGAASSGFVVAASEAEGRLMVSYLGLRSITAAEAYRSHVLPILVSLSTELRNVAVLGVLRSLPQLTSQDRSFGAWLAQVPFVPNNKGELHSPGELYDPRNPDLAALLDSEGDFPAASLLLEAAGSTASAASLLAPSAPARFIDAGGAAGGDGEASGRGLSAAPPATDADGSAAAAAGDASLVLYMLQQLGLRTTATLDTLLRAARFVERVANAAAAAAAVATAEMAAVAAAAPAVEAQTPASVAAEDDSDMAVARGKALLVYLEAEAGRIMAPVGASTAAIPVIAASSAGSGALAAGSGSGIAVVGGNHHIGSGTNNSGTPGPGAGARKFAAGLFSKARELFLQGGQEQPAVAEVHNFWQELARIRWCPVLPEPPAPGLPWPPRHAVPRLAAPRTIRPPSDMWLCSSCMFLVDGECRSSALAAGLGWRSPLGGSVLAQQLLQLGELHAQVTDPALSQVLAGVVPLLYRSLAALGPNEAPVARGMLHGSRCVWVGNGFAPAGKVAFRGSLDLSPWLYVMPAELAPFKDLLLSCGAADGFSAVQYCSVLQDMAEATGVAVAQESQGSMGDGPGPATAAVTAAPPPQPVTEVQLGQVVAVAQALADLSLPPGATIYLPDERGVLARAADLAFNDAPWLAGQPSSASVRLVHPRISAHVAARLGTPSLRRLLLAASADCMALGTVGGAEAFGQSEALTTRLRHIIGDYPEGPGVLMELLQNADDAGATSLELMLDDTTYPSGSILSPAMAVWQGPALLVANDAVFSPSDFANISRIGQDSKASRPTSIGRFGLGFNAVYHFTDLPCFVSGDYLVMFDPHAKYLPGVSAAQPGLKIAFARAQLLQQFPDAFKPFTHLGCDMRERFMGTLFRFPLRGPTAAAASDIKTSPCSPADVAALLESFRCQLPSALLFLKNIRTVTAYYRTAPSNRTDAADASVSSGGGTATASTSAVGGVSDAASVRLLFQARRELVASASAMTGGASDAALAAALQLAASEPGDIPSAGLLQSVITRFIAGSSSSATDLPTFYKRLANTNPSALPNEMGLMQLRMETNAALLTSGGVAASVASRGSVGVDSTSELAATDADATHTASEQWLVCNAVGGGAARDMALKAFRNHGTKMVPWVGVAALVPAVSGDNTSGATGNQGSVNLKENSFGGGSTPDLDGRAFCFLPLPIRTGLPVHVNGYFELSSNRRDIWYGGDMSGAGAARSSWNVTLMTDALAPCYGRVLVAMAQRAGPGEELYGLLPSLDISQPWSHLVSALYQQHLGKLPIVWTRAGGGRWIRPTEALFADAACAAEPLLRNLLVALGLPLACSMPAAAEANLLRGVPSATALEPRHVRLHLSTMLRAFNGDAAAVAQRIAVAAADTVAATAADTGTGAIGVVPAAAAAVAVADAKAQMPRYHAGAKLPPLTAAAAALLWYCLSDLDPADVPSAATVSSAGGGGNSTTSSQQQQQQQQQQQKQQRLQRLQLELDGLPLLPLADGTLGRLQALPQAGSAAGKASGRDGRSTYMYVLTHGSVEEEVLAGVRNRCLAPGLPAPLMERLQQVAERRLFNVQRLTPSLLNSTLLPLLLPPSWQGAEEVEWAPQLQPASQQQQQPPELTQNPQQQLGPATATTAALTATPQLPTAAWIRALWRWLSNREDVLQLASWPVLPIQGGRLGMLMEKSMVLREGDWTEGVSSALLRLGCRFLDTTLLPGGLPGTPNFNPGSSPAIHTVGGQNQQQHRGVGSSAAAAAAAASVALQVCVQQPSLTGVMAAFAAAKARADSQVQAHVPGGTGLGMGPAGVFGAVSDRRWGTRVPSTGSLGAAGLPTASQTSSSGGGGDAQGPGVEPSWSARLSSLTVVERRQLRSYLLQSRWFAGPAPPPPEDGLDLLRSLPIFEVFPDLSTPAKPAPEPTTGRANTPLVPPTSATLAQQQQHQLTALRHFTALEISRHRLAPPDTDPRVLSSAFLRADSPAEESLLERHLGVPRLSHAELLGQHIGTRATELPRDALGSHVAGLLVRVVEFTMAGATKAAAGAEAQRLREALCDHPLIPTTSPSGDLRRPAELHDPRVEVLTALLPAESAFFPAAAILAVPTNGAALPPPPSPQPQPPQARLLDALGLLGMVRTVDMKVLLTAANALQTDYVTWASTPASASAAAATTAPVAKAATASVTEASLLSRARALLKQLELWSAQYGSMGGGAGAGPGREVDSKQAWGQLMALCWCPVMKDAPEPGLPWSPKQPLLAPPRVVRPPADAWLVGATLHIVERSVGQPLQAALGWNAVPRVSVLAAQLIELGRMHAYQPRRLIPAPPPTAVAAAVGDAGGSNVDASDATGSSSDEAERCSTVKSSAKTDAVMDSDSDTAASSLTKSIGAAVDKLYNALSAAVDGPEGDLVAMSFERPDSPCVWVGTGFVLPNVAVLRSEGDFRPYLWVVPEPLHQYSRLLLLMGVMDRSVAQHYAAGLAALAAAAGGMPLDDDSLALALQLADCAADALAIHGRPTGQFFVPDAAGVMTPAPELFFNDAEWLDARDVQMAHGALPQATAEALGVRSLRYAHEVEAQLTAALPCPSPAELRERLGLQAQGADAAATSPEAAAVTFLFELLEVADALGLRSVRLVLDARQHPAQSLLQPALAAFQGPALCVILPDVALSTEDLAALLCSRAQPPSVRGRATAFSVGLQSAFLVSELLMAVSGNSTYMFDPSGAYLGGGGTGPAAGGGGGGGGCLSPRAKQYVHVSSDLLSTFADQFAVWSFADGYDIRGHVNATLLRLPLRRTVPPAVAASAASARERGGSATPAAAGGRGLRSNGLAVATLESVEAALQQFAVHAPRSLLFLQSLYGIEVSLLRPSQPPARAPAAGSSAVTTAECAAATATNAGSIRRELLLQASLVSLDSERPRPDFNAATTAARQRSGGPAALKALALAFGRSLGRGANQENPKHYLSPLELHIMAHNALLLPYSDSLDSDPSQPPPAASMSAAAAASRGSALGLTSGTMAVQGNTVYRERWLVSSCHDVDGVPLPAAAVAATGGGGRPELVAAAAACIARDEQRNLFPVRGLYAPVYLPEAAAARPSSGGPVAAAASGGSASALGRMPFLVAGHFYLSRRNGKHIVPPFGRAEGGTAAAASYAAASGSSTPAGDSAAAAAPLLLPHLQHRCEHNRRALDLAATAWQNLATYFCSVDNYNGPRDRLYNIFPDMAAATSTAGYGGDATVDETALYCVRQMYAGAARLPMWRLRTGRFVHLPEGCFLQPTTEGLGPAAMGFMARQLPLFDVPWAIKQHLEAADVHGLRTVSPAVVRPLLKNLGRRHGGGPGGGGGGGKMMWPGLTVLEATELLQFCSADLKMESPAAPAAGVTAADTALTPAGAAAVGRACGRGPAAVAPPPAATSGGAGGGSPTQQQQGGGVGVGGLFDELTSQVRNVVGELVGPALYDQLRQQALGILGDSATSQASPAAAAATTATASSAAAATAGSAAAANPSTQPRYHPARVMDCRGLPVPTAAGIIESLGTGTLLVAPPLAALLAGPPALLPPNCASEFVHSECVAKMAEYFKEPQYRARLGLRLYTLEDLARHVRTALPPGWDYPLPPPVGQQLQQRAQQQQYLQQIQLAEGGVGPTGLGRAWDGGNSDQSGHSDSPSGLWLWQLWVLVNGLLETSCEWQTGVPVRSDGNGELHLDPLYDWPLLPVLGSGQGAGAGVLLPVRHCRMVICLPPPPPTQRKQQQQQQQQESKGTVAGLPISEQEEGPAAAAGPVPALRELAPTLSAPWSWLAPALHAIGCPLLDPRFRSALSRHCVPHADGLPAHSQTEAAAVSSAATARGSVGAAAIAALVEKMRLCDAACGGVLPWRCGSRWDHTTRAAVLGLLAEATSTTIDPADIIFLRRLPIYPTHGGDYIALEEDSPPSGGLPSSLSSSLSAPSTSSSSLRGVTSFDSSAPGLAPVVCSADLMNLVPGLEAALPASIPRRLLMPQPGASRLYTVLNVPALTTAGFLATVVLPHLGSLPDGMSALLLTHVQANWSRLRADESLLATLRETPFVLTADGDLKRPGELYDPDHPLFAAAFLGCPVFPREQFAMPAWLTVLRDAGMQHKVTAAAFLAAAAAVAARGAALHMALKGEGIPEHGADLADPFLASGATEVPAAVAGARAKVTAAAEQLVMHLAGPQGLTLGGGREWWANLAKVAFVPATLGLPGSRKARQLLTRYSDAAAASDWPLVWSVLPVVAADRQVPASTGHGQLRIKSPPPLAAVVAHMRRVGADAGEEALSAWPASAGSVEDAFRAILSYLDREGISGQKAAQLRDVAFVPVARGTLLAPPRRLYVRLKEDFAPFAFEVPPALASFTPLLKSLGAQDEPRAQDLVESLRALAATAGNQPLNPNQRAAIIRLLTHVAALGGAGAAATVATGPGGAGAVGGGRAVGGSAADVTYLNTARKERRLLVLSSDGRLVSAHSAVSVGEGGGGTGAGRLLGRLDPGALTLTHPALPEAVTRWLGCPRLGDVAEERLDPGHPLEPVEEIQGFALREARALMASPTFISACHALLRTHAPLVRGMTTHGSLHEVAMVLRAAAPRLTFMRSLRTIAVLRATGAALSPAAEVSRVAFDFVEAAAVPPQTAAAAPPPFGVITGLAVKSAPGSGSGRIFVAEPPSHLPVSWLLASVVSRVLGSPVVLPLQPLFTISSGELQQLQPVLLPGGFDAGLETAAQAGVPGAPLLPADAALLQLKPLRRYCAGEVVAYQRTVAAVPAAAAAAAAAERRLQSLAAGPAATAPETAPGTAGGGGGDGGNMCYGRVAAHCVPADSAAGGISGGVHRVLVEVEPGVVQHLLSTHVFCFRSAASDCPTPAKVAATDVSSSSSSSATANPADRSAAASSAGGGDDASLPCGFTGGSGAAAADAATASTSGLAGPTAAGATAEGGVLAPVSSSEMLAAVRDMMAAAGMPLAPSTGQLLGQVAALQEKLAAAEEQLAQAKCEAASSATEAENARGAWQCKICFSRDVDSAYTTCGHTICARCASAAGSNRCPVCRKPSQSLLRLYRT